MKQTKKTQSSGGDVNFEISICALSGLKSGKLCVYINSTLTPNEVGFFSMILELSYDYFLLTAFETWANWR